MLTRLAATLLAATVLGAGPVAAADPDPVEAAIDVIKTAIAAGNHTDAMKEVNKLLAQSGLSDRDTAAALGQKATIETEMGRPEAAIAALGSALQFDPDNFWLRMRSCNANLAFGFMAPARQDCTLAAQVLRHERDPEEALRMRQYLDFTEARIALTSGDIAHGLALARGLESKGSPFPSWHVDMLIGDLLSRSGDARAAIDRFRQGLAAYDTAVPAAQVSDGQGGDAIRAGLHFRIGLAHEDLGDLEAARAEYDTAFVLLPDPDPVLEPETTKGSDTGSRPAARLRRESEAIAYASCSLNLRLGHADAVARCGWLSDRQPSNTVYLDALAQAHQGAGDPDKARELLEKALRLDPENRLIRESLAQLP